MQILGLIAGELGSSQTTKENTGQGQGGKDCAE